MPIRILFLELYLNSKYFQTLQKFIFLSSALIFTFKYPKYQTSFSFVKLLKLTVKLTSPQKT